jgi:hypothetical protein
MANPFGPLYSIDFVVLVLCAIAWFRAAQVENVPPWIWAGLSIFVYAFTWLWLHWGIFGCLIGQGLLLATITAYRVWQSAENRE